MSISHVSVPDEIRNLAIAFGHQWRNLPKAVSHCFEIFLTVKSAKENDNDTAYLKLLTKLRLFSKKHDEADSLENFEDYLNHISQTSSYASNVIRFLCQLELLSQLASSSDTPTRFFDVSTLSEMDFNSKRSQSSLIRSVVPVLKFRPFTLMNGQNDAEYPTLPKNLSPIEHDEGFEDCSDTPRSGASIPTRQCSSESTYSAPKVYCALNDQKILQALKDGGQVPHADLLTEYLPVYFLYRHLMTCSRTAKITLSSTMCLIDTVPYLVISLDFLVANFKLVLLGIESDIFRSVNGRLAVRPNLIMLGFTPETLKQILSPLASFGDKLLSIEKCLSDLATQKSTVIRKFVISVRHRIRLIHDDLLSLCSNMTDDKIGLMTFLLEISRRSVDIECLSTYLETFLHVSSTKRLPIVSWLLTSLFEICIDSERCSSEAFLFRPVFCEVCIFYFRILIAWLTKGQCPADTSDFFVEINKEVDICDERTLWTLGFKLTEEAVPMFLRHHVSDIFMRGKTVNLLRKMKIFETTAELTFDSTNAEYLWSDQVYSVSNAVYPEYILSSNISCQNFVDSLLLDVCKHTKSLSHSSSTFLKQSGLIETFGVFRDLYLGANGMFFAALAERIFPLLVPLSGNPFFNEMFYPHIFNQALDESLELAGIKFDCLKHNTVSFKFDMKSLQNDNDNSSQSCSNSTDSRLIDLFDLHCEVQWPCNIVVTESCFDCMKKVFNFLLALRWSVWALDDTWSFLSSASNQHCFLNGHLLTLYLREMRHFLMQLEIYFRHQAVDVCWSRFETSLGKCQDLDQICNTHSRYLWQLANRCLMSPNVQHLTRYIRKLLDCALQFRFCVVQNKNEFNAVEAYKTFSARSKALITVIDKLASRLYQPHLNELLIRLNFNEYYTT